MPVKPDPIVRAFVRAHATLRLITDLPESVISEASPGTVRVQLLAPGGPRCSIRVSSGSAEFRDTRTVFPTVSLWCPSPAALGDLLSGGKSTVIPVPSSPRFLGGIKAFRALTGAVQKTIQDPEHRARLLLMGTLYALQEVAARDAYVAARAARIPSGTIAVFVENDEIGGWFRKSEGGFTSGPGKPDGQVNAELAFADRNTAEALLTGTLPAMLAVAERRVRIHGRLPMIQNLFPILDRVAVYMGG